MQKMRGESYYMGNLEERKGDRIESDSIYKTTLKGPIQKKASLYDICVESHHPTLSYKGVGIMSKSVYMDT